MTNSRITIHVTFVLSLLLLMNLLAPSAAPGAVGASDVSSSVVRNFGGTSPLVIPAAAFSSDGLDADAIQFNTTGFLYGTPVAGDACVRAPAFLPQGARITALRMMARDKTTEEQIDVALDRYRNDGSAPPEPLGQTTSINSGDDVPDWTSDGTIANGEVDYASYSYYVRACFVDNASDLRLYQVNIEYTEQLIFADGFERGDTSRWSAAVPASAPASIARQEYASPFFIPAAQFNYAANPPGGVVFALDTGYVTGDLTYLTRFLQAPIYLPNGAQVTSIFIHGYDNDPDDATLCAAGAASNLEFWVQRYSAVTGAFDMTPVASDASSGARTGWTTLSDLTNWTFDLSNYTYYLVVRLCGNAQRIYGAQIFYSMP